MLSVIIPSRSPEYLNKTVLDILDKAEGRIEVIVILDGIWPEEKINDPRVFYLHHGTVHDSYGMRDSINKGVAVSRGDYIMKCDEHVMFDKGFDTKLKADCEDNWVVIPRRKRLDAENWAIIKDGRPDIDYMMVDYPYQRPNDITCGLHGSEWKRPDRADILIDDTPTMQGSCYFMSRKHWDTTIKRMQTEKYGPFTQEAQEISMATWLSGGRVVVNKKTWYAHLHKGKRGKGYGFSNRQYEKHMRWNERGRLFCIDYWMNTKDYKYDFEWFLQKFWPVPTWMDNWKEQIEKDKPLAYVGVDISAPYE